MQTQITDLGDTDEHPGEALRSLDAELAATIDRLQRARMELDLILERAAPTGRRGFRSTPICSMTRGTSRWHWRSTSSRRTPTRRPAKTSSRT